MAAVLAAFLIGCASNPAEAPQPEPGSMFLLCGDRSLVVGTLKQRGQILRGRGRTSAGFLVEHWASDEEWTFILNRPDGDACLYGDGRAWEFAPSKAGSV